MNIYLTAASSWGGAVCIELMRSRHWTGPTVLLAPAQFKVAQARGLSRDRNPRTWPYLPHNHPATVVIVHGDCDDVIPLDDR